jgi:hypothetical protein
LGELERCFLGKIHGQTVFSVSNYSSEDREKCAMNKKLNRFLMALLIASLFAIPMGGLKNGVRAQGQTPPALKPSLSADGQTLYNGLQTMVVVADPSMAGKNIPAGTPAAGEVLTASRKTVSTWSITYLAAGKQDQWGATCLAFPTAAKAAINAAAAIWANLLQSRVPIKIQLCWSDIGSSYILGYSGGEPQHANFPGAPLANTWYTAALANSLAGYDLDIYDYDEYLTINSGFNWYFATIGAPPAGKYDLETVAAHEMGHGVNIAGMTSYAGGSGSFGYNGYPQIYDTFMEDQGGTRLTSYANPSTALGSLLSSDSLWFDGPNAVAGGGGQRTQIYAPNPWSDGSSYSHLDYNAYVMTWDNLMVYALGAQNVRHLVGPRTQGMLKDMGWALAAVPTPITPAGGTDSTNPTFKWSKIEGVAQYNLVVYKGSSLLYSKIVNYYGCGSTTCMNTPTNKLGAGVYAWEISAFEGSGWTPFSVLFPFTVSLPFNSSFKSNAHGWDPVLGPWSVAGGYYKSAGVANMFASAAHTGTYDIFCYEVKLKRTGCSSCENGIWFNGTPLPLDSQGQWYNGYEFVYTNDGYWSIRMYSLGSPYALTGWTYSPEIVNSTGNTLTVTFNSSTQYAQFLINYITVANGYLGTFTSGQVGVSYYQDSSLGNKFYVDKAMLVNDAPPAMVTDNGNPSPLETIHIDDSVIDLGIPGNTDAGRSP